MQLVDAPDMGYYTSDLPHPRGEIVAHSARVTPGYYNDAKSTEEAFVTIGGKKFFRTGDIGELVDGRVQVIDPHRHRHPSPITHHHPHPSAALTTLCLRASAGD